MAFRVREIRHHVLFVDEDPSEQSLRQSCKAGFCLDLAEKFAHVRGGDGTW